MIIYLLFLPTRLWRKQSCHCLTQHILLDTKWYTFLWKRIYDGLVKPVDRTSAICIIPLHNRVYGCTTNWSAVIILIVFSWKILIFSASKNLHSRENASLAYKDQTVSWYKDSQYTLIWANDKMSNYRIAPEFDY